MLSKVFNNPFVRELFAEKTRILLTVLALAWGTIAISFTLAVGQGLRNNFVKAVDSVGLNVISLQAGVTSKAYRGQSINQAVNLTWQDYQSLKQSDLPFKTLTVQLTSQGALSHQNHHFGYGMINAVTPQYAQIRNIPVTPPGRFINQFDMDNSLKVIVLGNKVALSLFPHEPNVIGKIVRFGGWQFRVIGVMKPKIQFNSFGWPDAYQTWIPLSTYRALANPYHVNAIIFVPRKNSNVEQLKTDIRQVIAFNHHLDAHDQSIVQFQDQQATQDKTNRVFLGLQVFLGFVGGLTLLVSGIGITNVMYVSVANATREIGIRMAIGARPYQVLIHYLFEALLVTLIGGILGIVITWFLIGGINMIPLHAKIFQYIGRPRPVLSWSILGLIVLILGSVGFLAGFFPAYRASKVQPAIALRHERGG